MFKKLPNGKYIVTSETGKKLSKPLSSHTKAVERLRQVEYFKNKGK